MNTTVFTAGCFDVLHVGHIRLLMFCRQIAGPTGKVIVSLDWDHKITTEKGPSRPIFNYNERRSQILSLGIVDSVWSHYDNDNLFWSIHNAKIDCIVVGDSYRNKPVIGEDKVTVIYFKQNEYSSTSIIDRILKKQSKHQ